MPTRCLLPSFYLYRNNQHIQERISRLQSQSRSYPGKYSEDLTVFFIWKVLHEVHYTGTQIQSRPKTSEIWLYCNYCLLHERPQFDTVISYFLVHNNGKNKFVNGTKVK
jgi:hypothetical protein